jgi:hypothetical protein
LFYPEQNNVFTVIGVQNALLSTCYASADEPKAKWEKVEEN